MKKFTEAITKSLEEKNWYAGLFLALAIPDICGSLENPTQKAEKRRYIAWFDRYLGEKYRRSFSGDDCYYFRCACLHQGLARHTKMTSQRIHFIEPPSKNVMVHMNTIKNVLQMQIDRFCQDICAAVDKWEDDIKNDLEIKKRISGLINIYPIKTIERLIKFNES